MPIATAFAARSPGELRSFSLDLSSDLTANDYIVSVTTTLTISEGTDPKPASLLATSPQILANSSKIAAIIVQKIGTNSNKIQGFRASSTYTWKITATTNLGEILVWSADIPILAR